MRVASELNVRFRANKTGLSPLTVFIPIVPERSLCCTSFLLACAPEVSCLAIVLSLLVPHLCLSFGASGRLCFGNVAFPGHLLLHFVVVVIGSL